MATIPGSYVRTGLTGIPRIDYIIDVLLAPNLLEYRQICIHHEKATFLANKTFKFSYQNWNPDYPVQLFLNNNPNPLAEETDPVPPETEPTTNYTINYEMGQVTFPALENGDHLMATYCFDYFPVYVLKGFILKAVETVNTAGNSFASLYSIDNAPSNWDGVISDLVMASCMERLILDYDLWKGRLIFAIGPQNLVDGGGDIVNQLTTVKQNCEDRAYKTIDNENFRNGAKVSLPTQYYYQSLLVGSSTRTAMAGSGNFGPLRGFKQNKLYGSGALQ